MNRMPQNQENPKILPILIQTKKGKDTKLPLYPFKTISNKSHSELI